MKVIGIDPGLAVTGYGVIQQEGNVIRCLCYGGIRTESGLPVQRRLGQIHERLGSIIEEYHPDLMAVEELFFNKNVSSALTVGMARGVVLLTAELNGIEIESYTPLQVKQAIVGYGRAVKRQIQQMVRVILGLNEIPTPVDAADALAIAICHVNTHRFDRMVNLQR